MVYGETSTFDIGAGGDHRLGPPSRRMSASADGPLGYGRRRERSESRDRAKPEPEDAALVLGNFQGVVVIDMGFVMVSTSYPAFSVVAITQRSSSISDTGTMTSDLQPTT